MISNMGSQWADVVLLVDRQQLMFSHGCALNTAGDQTVQLGLAGLIQRQDCLLVSLLLVMLTTGMDNLNEMVVWYDHWAVGMHGR